MNGINNPQVMTLLDGAGKPAPIMTRSLSVLGDGSMSDGLIALWENGQKNGIVKGVVGTSLVFTVGIGLYTLAKNKIAESKVKQDIRMTCATEEADEFSVEEPTSKHTAESALESKNLEENQ